MTEEGQTETREVVYGPGEKSRAARFRAYFLPLTQEEKDHQTGLGKFLAVVLVFALIASLAGGAFLAIKGSRPILSALRTDRSYDKILALESEGRVAEAFDQALQNHAADRTDPRWIKLIASIATRQGGDDISPFWEQAKKAGAMEADEWALWSQGLLTRGKPEEAYERALEFKKAYPDDVRALLVAAESATALEYHREAGAYFERAENLSPEDERIAMARSGSRLRKGSLTPEARRDLTAPLWERAGQSDELGQLAIDTLWNSRDLSADQLIRLAELTSQHPLTPFRGQLRALRVQIQLRPPLREALIESAVAKHGDRRGIELADLGNWLNDLGAHEATHRLGTDERLRLNAHFWEPYLEALLATGKIVETEAALRSEDCPLSGPHLDLVQVHLGLLRGDDRETIENRIKGAIDGAVALKKPLLLVEIGRVADGQGSFELAQEAWNWARKGGEGVRPALEHLLAQARRLGRHEDLARISAEAAEDEQVGPDFIERAIYYNLLAGIDLEEWINRAREYGKAGPHLPQRQVLSAFAEARLGNFSTALERIEGVQTGSLRPEQRALVVHVLAGGHHDPLARKIRSEIGSTDLIPAERNLLARALEPKRRSGEQLIVVPAPQMPEEAQ